MSLTGKVALITGGRRVGSDLARLLADRGVAVAMTYHTSRQAIEATIEGLETRGANGIAVGADLSRADEAEAAIRAVVARFGRLDMLVNMASVYHRTPFEGLAPSDFDTMIAANLAAPYHTSVFAAKQMLTQAGDEGIKGRIVSVGDWSTDRPYKHYLPYLVAKGGLTTMTLALAKELAPDILVNLVQPAMIDPPPHFTKAERDAVVALTPLKRVGTPGDVNRLILYLLEGTNFTTGSSFRVDGGRFLGSDPL